MESPQSVAHRPGPTRDTPRTDGIAYTDDVSQPPIATFADRARAWMQEREEQHRAGELALNTVISYRRAVRVAVEALGPIPIAEVHRGHIRQMHGDNRFRPTVANLVLDVVRRILREAEEEGLRPRGSIPAGNVRHHAEVSASRPASPAAVLKAFLTCAEIRAGRLPICHPTIAALFQLVALTGARPSEIRQLEWASVDLFGDPPVLRLQRHKTSRLIGEKTIVLSPLARGVLLSLRPDAPQHPRWVFPSHQRPGNHYADDITKPWRRVAIAAGLGRTNLRDLRSGLATNTYDRGVPLEIIQEMLGHRSMHTTRRYTRISPRKVHSAYEVFSNMVLSSSRRHR